jgi:uncharacterized protein YbcV (DUF1398 family)
MSDMAQDWKEIARITLEGSENDTMTFPEGVKLLMEGGFDGYSVDFRCGTRTYYLPSGEVLELETARLSVPVAERFDVAVIKDAISEAQQMVPGYSYKKFCAKVMGAGCAGYLMSLLGKRVVYYGRTGDIHTEYFPGTKP